MSSKEFDYHDNKYDNNQYCYYFHTHAPINNNFRGIV